MRHPIGRRARLALALLLAGLSLGFAGCDLGEKIALKPIETTSRFCTEDQSLYRVGSVLFCAFPNQRWSSRLTYSVSGPSVAAFDQQVRDVIATASCLTGRPFEATVDGDFTATIDNKVVPADASGQTRHDDNTLSLHSQLGLVRGTLRVQTTNASPDVIGRDLEKGLWDFLGIKRPKPIALAFHALSSATVATQGVRTREVMDGSQFCRPENILMQTDGVFFCARPTHDWLDAAYAVVSQKSDYDAVVPVVARFASRLTQVRLEPSRKPELLIVLTEYELTKATFAELLRTHDVQPRGPSAEASHLQHSFQDDVRKALGRTLGKPIAAAMADFMSTKASSSESIGNRRALTTVIGLHDRSTVDAEGEILQSFLDFLQIELPAYNPPAACR